MTDGICPFATQVNANHLDDVVITPGYLDRVGFVDHAAGGFYTTLDDGGFWVHQGVSVHFAIGRGPDQIAQIANIFDTPWAEGRDQDGGSVGPQSRGVSWPPFATMGKRNPNGYMVSTEHEDWEIVNGVARAIPGSQWTEAEYAADLKVKRWCIDEVKRVTGKDLMRFGIDSLAGHHMFDPVSRAECPGAFWRNEYRQRLFNDLMGGSKVADGDGWQVKEKEIVLINEGVEVVKIGDAGGQFPGRIGKNFGGEFWWLRMGPLGNPDHDIASAYWSKQEGD